MKEYLAAAASAHHPAVLVSLSSSSARVEEDIAVLAILTFSSSVRNFGPHLNEGGHRRRLFPPHRFILSSSSTAVFKWRWALQCSPSLPFRPAVPHRAQLQTHLNEEGHRRRLFPPPRFILSSSQQCSSARAEEDIVAASAHRPAVLASLSSSSAAVPPFTMRDLATAASAHHPAVLVSLSSYSAAVPLCAMQTHGGVHSLRL